VPDAVCLLIRESTVLVLPAEVRCDPPSLKARVRRKSTCWIPLCPDLNGHGLHTLSLLDFAAGEQVDSVRRISPREFPAVQMRLAWIRMNPRPYHLASWNCEVFANWLAGDTEPKSEQVGWTLVLGTLLGLAWLFARA
jgi:hypothetical protein